MHCSILHTAPAAGLLLAALASAAPSPQRYWPSAVPAYVPTAAAGSALPVASPRTSYGYGNTNAYAPATYDTTTYDTTGYGTDYTTPVGYDTAAYDTASVYGSSAAGPPANLDTGYVSPATYDATELTTPAGYPTEDYATVDTYDATDYITPATYDTTDYATTPNPPAVYDSKEIQCYDDDGTLSAVVDTQTVAIEQTFPDDGTTYPDDGTTYKKNKLRKRGSCFSSTGNYEYYTDPPTLDEVIGPAVVRPNVGHYGSYVSADQRLADAINRLDAEDEDDADDQPPVPNEYLVYGARARPGAAYGVDYDNGEGDVDDEENVTTEGVSNSLDEYLIGNGGTTAGILPAGYATGGGMMAMNNNNAPAANPLLQTVADGIDENAEYTIIDETDVADLRAAQLADLTGNYDVIGQGNANAYTGDLGTGTQDIVADYGQLSGAVDY
ncbi:hypothetical protein TWF696_001334 [Orbilia brochopaga]|uniref:Uncharacterized protein n=1 Tax=Orbilia brochopaga TaxID=3140254 RepID=A0AAV9UB39_9PEZI